MNKYYFLSILALIISVFFFLISMFEGNLNVGVVLIFPFIMGSDIFSFIGMIFLFVAIISFMYASAFRNFTFKKADFSKDSKLDAAKKTSFKGGGLVLIGPIPIVFGANWKITLLLIVMGLILTIVLLFGLDFF